VAFVLAACSGGGPTGYRCPDNGLGDLLAVSAVVVIVLVALAWLYWRARLKR
jgi:hypothetical protein